MAVEHAAGLIQDAWHQRAFQRGVREVQLQQSFDVMRSGLIGGGEFAGLTAGQASGWLRG
jgi:hypothetical protein